MTDGGRVAGLYQPAGRWEGKRKRKRGRGLGLLDQCPALLRGVGCRAEAEPRPVKSMPSALARDEQQGSRSLPGLRMGSRVSVKPQSAKSMLSAHTRGGHQSSRSLLRLLMSRNRNR